MMIPIEPLDTTIPEPTFLNLRHTRYQAAINFHFTQACLQPRVLMNIHVLRSRSDNIDRFRKNPQTTGKHLVQNLAHTTKTKVVPWTLGLESLSFPVIQWEWSSRLSGKRNILDQSKERQQSLSVHRRIRSIFPQFFRYWVGMTVVYLGLIDWSCLPQNGTLKTSPEAKGHQSG